MTSASERILYEEKIKNMQDAQRLRDENKIEDEHHRKENSHTPAQTNLEVVGGEEMKPKTKLEHKPKPKLEDNHQGGVFPHKTYVDLEDENTLRQGGVFPHQKLSLEDF